MTSFMKNRKAQLIFLQFFLIALLLSAEVTVTYMAKKNAAGIEAKSEVKNIILGSIQEFEGKTVFYDSFLRESIRRYAIDEIQADCDTEYTISEFYTDISTHQKISLEKEDYDAYTKGGSSKFDPRAESSVDCSDQSLSGFQLQSCVIPQCDCDLGLLYIGPDRDELEDTDCNGYENPTKTVPVGAPPVTQTIAMEIGDRCWDVYQPSMDSPALSYAVFTTTKTTLEDVVNDYITNYNTRYGIVSYSVPWVSEFVFTEKSDYLEIVAVFNEELNPSSLKIASKGVTMNAGESMTIEIHNPMDFCVD